MTDADDIPEQPFKILGDELKAAFDAKAAEPIPQAIMGLVGKLEQAAAVSSPIQSEGGDDSQAA